jgi:hypothetical protein
VSNAMSNQPGIPDQRLGANWVPELQRKAGSRPRGEGADVANIQG